VKRKSKRPKTRTLKSKGKQIFFDGIIWKKALKKNKERRLKQIYIYEEGKNTKKYNAIKKEE
jgi:hypothetical protein